jgi:hypothetical protein
MKAIFRTGTSAALLGIALTTSSIGLGAQVEDAVLATLDVEKYFAGSAPSPVEGQRTVQTAQSVEIVREKPAAISNGGSYGIIAPLYRYADPLSLIRLVNGGLTPTTFSITVVGVPSGNNLGTAQIFVPGAASLQKSISEILTAANATPGVSDTTYSFYIQSAAQLAGYQHIIFSNSSGFLENVSVCKYNLNQSFSATAYAEGVINVHTSVLAGGTFPSQIELHNYASTTQTYILNVYESVTGALKGRASINAAANSTYLLPFTDIQQAIGWNPTATEIHANVSLSTTTGTTAPQASIGHTIVNTRQTNTVLNMTNVCAVNAPPAITVPGPTVTNTVTVATSLTSSINGTFNGWTGSTLFSLTNGQVWRQSSYAYLYHYAYRPDVAIFAFGSGYKMSVEGVASWIDVVRIP